MDVTGKTPISLLSEILVHKKIHPIFNLLMSGVGTNQGVFVYEVTAGTLVAARGQGLSKKQAKQEAAKAALEKLMADGTIKNQDGEDTPPTNLNVISPYREELRENAVGNLGDLCVTSHLPVPTYNLVREDGPPHSKTFEIVCQVSSFEQRGWGRTKQQAKHRAAKAMIDMLELLKVSDVGLKDSQDAHEDRAGMLEALQTKRVTHKLSRASAKSSLLGQQMGLSIIIDWTVEKLVEVKNLRVPTTEHFAQLMTICDSLELVIFLSDVKAQPGGGVIRVMTLSTRPEISFLGQGKDKEAADNKAAWRALRYFDIVVSR